MDSFSHSMNTTLGMLVLFGCGRMLLRSHAFEQIDGWVVLSGVIVRGKTFLHDRRDVIASCVAEKLNGHTDLK